MFKHIFIIYIFNLVISNTNSVLNDNDQTKRCYDYVEKGQQELDKLITTLKQNTENSVLPKVGTDYTDKVNRLKALIQKTRKLKTESSTQNPLNNLFNLTQNVTENEVKVSKTEKKLKKIKKLGKLGNEFEKLLPIINDTYKFMDIILNTHNATYKICKQAEADLKDLRKDVNYITENYITLEKERKEIAAKEDNLYKQRTDILDEIVKTNKEIELLRIPESYIANYLCDHQGHLQQSIDTNIDLLHKNKDKILEIIKATNNNDIKNSEEINNVLSTLTKVNNEVETVNEALKNYEDAIPSFEYQPLFSKKEIDKVNDELKALQENISGLHIETYENEFLKIEHIFQEVERKLDVIEFIFSDNHIKQVRKEITFAEKYSKQTSGLRKNKEIMQDELENIEKSVQELMKQTVCKTSGNET